MKGILRVLFSRYAVSALFFLAELVGVALLISYASTYSYIIYFAITVINALFVVGLISRDVNPEFKVSWAVILSVIPILGGALYYMFYSRKLTRRETLRLKSIDGLLNSESEGTVKCLAALGERDSSAAGRAVSLMHDDIYAGLYRGSRIKYFPSGEELYSAMLLDIAEAKHFIFLEYFIIEEGEMWQGIYSILRKKAGDGVTVRLIYDDVGCMKTLPRGFCARLRREGIDCRCFGRVSSRLMANHNNRDHRKITVIDGRIAYTGGVNIADEYINIKKRFGYWKDGGVRAEGKCALGFTKLFLTSYYLCAGVENREAELSLLALAERAAQTYSEEGDGGYYIPFGDGPAPLSAAYTSKNAIMNIINRSERYLYITTPYLIIDYDITEALKSAACRGVDVRIITPGIPDKKIVKIMTKSTYPTLISAGVRIFEYAPGFIHEKLIVSDDTGAVVGSINLDYRSLVHHFEDALWIYASPEIIRMRDGFLSTLSKSREISGADAELNFAEKAVRALVRIFSPLL